MIDESILIPGQEESTETPTTPTQEGQYLEKDNFLSEYSTDGAKAVVRQNLNVPSKEGVYTKEEVVNKITQYITEYLKQHLQESDPHKILPIVDKKLSNNVLIDGSTPFTSPQGGVDPIKDEHLATKKYIDKSLQNHLSSSDPHNILKEVDNQLKEYYKGSQVYTKEEVYTRNEINSLLQQYIKSNGSTPFTAAQSGVDPTLNSHLVTKRYVDKLLNAYLDYDPNRFSSIINKALANYVKNDQVYNKNETYSRYQLNLLINELIKKYIQSNLSQALQETNKQISSIKENYAKKDGSTEFSAPQKGVEAVKDTDLVILGQVKEILNEVKSQLESKINEKECLWITSGPVETTVGFLEDNTKVPEVMTLQETLDTIFYGKGIKISVQEYTPISQVCNITVCLSGSKSLVDYVEVYQNDQLIYTLSKDDFIEKCIIIPSNPVLTDTTFTAKVYYTNDIMYEAQATTKCCPPVFVGLLPKWKFGSTITMDYLVQLSQEDTKGTQNRFLLLGDDMQSITFKYKFTDSSLRHPFIVLPVSYPDLQSMTTKAQSFGIDAFDVIDMIPLTIQGVSEDIIFKMYIYRQALSSLDQEITFNFVNNE